MGDMLKKAYDDAEQTQTIVSIFSVWHKPDETPEEKRRILFESKTHGIQFGGYDHIEHFCSRDEFIDPVEPDDVVRWLYVEDIDKLQKKFATVLEQLAHLNLYTLATKMGHMNHSIEMIIQTAKDEE